MNNLKTIAISALEAGLDVAFVGEENSGKFTLAKMVAKDAPIINGIELTNDNIIKIQSLIAESPFVIIRGLHQRNVGYIKAIIESKSILATPIDTHFVITATEPVEIKHIFTLTTPKPSKDGWIDWAKASGVHQKMIDLVANNDGFFELHGINKLYLIDKIIRSNSKNSELLINILTNNQELATQLTIRNIPPDPNLLELINTTETSDLIATIKQSENPAKLLASIVCDPKAIGLIDMAIKDNEIQKSIDNLLLELS